MDAARRSSSRCRSRSERRRRPGRPDPQSPAVAGGTPRSRRPGTLRAMVSVHVATLNIRNLADRWDERLPLLLADMAALQPDLLGLQEVVYPLQQDRLIGAGGAGRYESSRAWAGRPEYGNALLVRSPLVAGDADRLDLGRQRSALRATVGLPGGATV